MPMFGCEAREGSTIHGFGIFATEKIKAGSVLWCSLPDEVERYHRTRAQVAELEKVWTEKEKEDFWRGAYIIDEETVSGVLPEMEEPSDGGEYMNHSCEPNCVWANDDYMLACRDINVGEEIVYDYSTSEIAGYTHHLPFDRCACGSDRCRGTVSGDAYLDPEYQQECRGLFTNFGALKVQRATAERFPGAMILGYDAPLVKKNGVKVNWDAKLGRHLVVSKRVAAGEPVVEMGGLHSIANREEAIRAADLRVMQVGPDAHVVSLSYADFGHLLMHSCDPACRVEVSTSATTPRPRAGASATGGAGKAAEGDDDIADSAADAATDLPVVTLIARRDLEPGTAITFDKRVTEADTSIFLAFDCKCGAEHCGKRISGFSGVPADKRAALLAEHGPSWVAAATGAGAV
uniref:SET domain-containing protein n=1 Tax=Bicosoecida sp. CB-2014 TaxID=1486930 RepID=A0A7S1GAJ5_9STRA|mmetsp:Transcript_25135/g.87686  ORF Transcript_25135/g.87686 Transcript_25135/m.87686 type:complete len:405 (+) Transcript_25135:69-1283(+)